MLQLHSWCVILAQSLSTLMAACSMEDQYILEWILCSVTDVNLIRFWTTNRCHKGRVWLWERVAWQMFSIICLNKPLNSPWCCIDSCEQFRKHSSGTLTVSRQHLLTHWDEPNYPCVSVCSAVLSWIRGLISFIREEIADSTRNIL